MNGYAENSTSTAVFLVPGQGADPRGALAQFHRATPELRAGIEDILTEIEEAAGEAGHGLREVLLTEARDVTLGPGLPQLANYTISVVLDDFLASIGVRPREIVGQSFGEIAALVCAGVFDISSGARAVCALNAAFRDVEGLGAMVLVNASERDTQRLLDAVGHPGLVVACVNTPKQTIVSGPTEAIEALLSAPTERRLVTLPVPYASHHPDLSGVADHFLAGIRGIRQRALRIPVHSPVRRRAYTDADDLHEALADCVIKPVHLPETLRDVAAHAPTTFVELGAGDALSRCAAATVPQARTFTPLTGDVSWLTGARARQSIEAGSRQRS